MEPDQPLVSRDAPTVEPSRAALVERWLSRVETAREHWKPVFDQMIRDQQFARGRQWAADAVDFPGGGYVANVTLRHIQTRVDAVYAKQPRHNFRKRERLLSQVWDGTPETLMQANQIMQMASQPDPITGQPNPMLAQQAALAQQILQEAQAVQVQNFQLRRMGRTLQLVYEYQLSEQATPVPAMLKMVVRRGFTTGVGYVKPGYQRLLRPKPETVKALDDVSTRLAQIEQASADIADGEIMPGTAEAEALRIRRQAIETEPDVLVREGLTLDYPASTAIIPDTNLTYLPEFTGCKWVAEAFALTRDEIQQFYGVDVGGKANFYVREKPNLSDSNVLDNEVHNLMAMREAEAGLTSRVGGKNDSRDEQSKAVVYEIYNREDGLVYTVCEGWPDFLAEPAAPDVYTERFWPWYVFAPNLCDDDRNPYPPSDVSLIRDAQMELNRAREGLREHRFAARPKTVSTKPLSEEDRSKLANHPANAILELDAIGSGEKVSDVLQQWAGPGIDPNLYSDAQAFGDIQRVGGSQEAQLGGISGGTATETSIAESSRMSTTASAIDDFETMLTGLARAGSQILLLNMSPETVQEVVGVGAVWPTTTKADAARELWLEVEAGSMGRPNQAQEVQLRERMMPYLMQIPGLKPSMLAKDLLSVVHTNANFEDWIDAGLPSITALNAVAGRGGGSPSGEGAGAGPKEDPRQQGGQGSTNGEQPSGARGRPGPPAESPTAGPPPGPNMTAM